MSEQTIVGTHVAVPNELVLHTLQQGSWPWLFAEIVRKVEFERDIVPLDPVLLIWPADRKRDSPSIADADTGWINERFLDPAIFSLRMVTRRDAERICRGWPDTADWKFNDEVREPEPEIEEVPWVAAATRRRSPFDV